MNNLGARRTIRLVLVLAVATVVAACGVLGDDNASGGIGGTSWSVTSIDAASTPADARPTMAFEYDGRLSGFSGCNTYTGTFRTDGDRITISKLATTMMACEADKMAVEQAFVAALSAATNWRLTEQGSLELLGADMIVAEPTGPAGTTEPG